MSLILVTNDDGITSKGIKALARALRDIGDVYIVAPETEQSAVAHALTLHRPLRFERINRRAYSINGTPTDCVILGVTKLLPRRPDVIVSGINNGGNLGDDITYSGTVAAAMEGTLLGIPSIAISLVSDTLNRGRHKGSYRLANAAEFAKRLVLMVLEKGLPPDTLLNVNVPPVREVKGVRFTRQGKKTYDNSIQELSDPRGRRFYWIGGGVPSWELGEDTDFEAIKDGYISVTPVHLDMTNHRALRDMRNGWKL
jgi:5'-nucleotidase